MKQYLIRFYDDDKNNFIGNQFENLECILIDTNKHHPLIKKKKFHPQLYFYEYIKKYPSEREFLTFSFKNIQITYDENLQNNGLEEYHIEELKNWCSKNKYFKKIVFFDWDKTTSIKNGFIFIEKYSKIELKAYLYFLLGGKERFKNLQKLFSFLNKNKVEFYILTNNSGAINSRKLFLDMIRLIDKKFKSSNLLYGLKYNHEQDKDGKLLKSNKLNFLEKEFPKILR